MLVVALIPLFLVNLCVVGLPVPKRVSVLSVRSVAQISGNHEPVLMDTISTGTLLALEHCRNLFKWDKWNCPREVFERHPTLSSNRETAFTKAIIAAGIAYSITKNCSMGDIKNCGCDSKFDSSSNNLQNIPNSEQYEKMQKYQASINLQNSTVINSNVLLDSKKNLTDFDWSWGGCSEDPTFATRVTKDLLNTVENNGVAGVKEHIGIHNYNVGAEIIRQTMIKKCRCHGVSGSCSIQTCWMQTSSFQHIAKKLKEKYIRAVRLSMEVLEKSISLANTIQKREDIKKRKISASEHSLVYIEQSPDYCVANSTQDWPGTRGRFCSRNQLNTTTSAEKRSCKNVCRQCGHKVKKQTSTVNSRCNCKFNWCCSVQCDTCIETVEEYYCQ